MRLRRFRASSKLFDRDQDTVHLDLLGALVPVGAARDDVVTVQIVANGLLDRIK